MICGHCKETNVNTQHVRDCSPAATSLDQERGRRERLGLDLDEQVARDSLPDLKARLEEVHAKLPDFPRARYALRDDDGTIKFYVVDRPQKGKWQGATFLKAQASDETWPIKRVSVRLAVLERIADDWQAAMILYTEKIQKCGCCGRTLTQKASLALGIGPICAKKMGLTA